MNTDVKRFYKEVKAYIEDDIFITEDKFIAGDYTFSDSDNEILIREFIDAIILLIGEESFGAYFVNAYKNKRFQRLHGARESIVRDAFIKAKQIIEG